MARNRFFTKKIYRSGFENSFSEFLKGHSIAFEYEKHTLAYVKEICQHCGEITKTGKYTPDFVIERKKGKRLIVETKGRFTSQDRTKMLNVKKSNPEEDIRIVFQRDNAIRKGSKTTYTDWATKNGFPSHIGKTMPLDWLRK